MTTNGTPPSAREQLLEAKARLEVARAEHGLARLQRRTKRLRESNILHDWMSGYQDLIDRLRTDEGRLLLAPSTVNDRRYGANWPFWRTWQEHAILRAQSRFLATENDLAMGAISGLTSYVIGDGFTYRWQARRKQKPPAELLDVLQWITDDYSARNQLPEFEQELFKRSRVDGEYFTRDFVDPGDGWRTWLEPVEPEQVMDAVGQKDASGETITLERGLFGVVTPEGNQRRAEGYWVCYDGVISEGELVPAAQMQHVKTGVVSTVKRGLPDFSYSTYEGLKAAGRCVQNMTESATVQASVAEIVELEYANPEEAQEYVDGDADYQTTNPWTGNQQANHRVMPGERRVIPKGQKYVQPPFSNGAPAWLQVTQAALRRAGVRWNAPEWLISGNDSQSSYASSMTTESPFVRRCTRWQGSHKRRNGENVRRAVRNACEAGVVRACGRTWSWRDVERLCDLQVEAPSLVTRNELEEAQCNQIRMQAGVLSPQSWAMKDGLDYDEQQANLDEHEGRSGKGGPGLGLDDDLGDGQRPEGAAAAGDGSDLRATVGGLQAIATLQGDAYGGKLPREAAVANVMLLFAFSRQEAESLFPLVEPRKTADVGQGGQPPGMPPAPPDDSSTEAGGSALAAMFEQQDLTEAGASASRKVGEVWQGQKGRWYTKRQDGRVVPARNPNAQPGGGGEKKKKAEGPGEGQGAAKGGPKPAAKAKPTVGGVARGIEALRAQAAPATKEQMLALVEDLMGLTVKDFGALKKLVGAKASGNKAEVAARLAKSALEKVRAKAKGDDSDITVPGPLGDALRKLPTSDQGGFHDDLAGLRKLSGLSKEEFDQAMLDATGRGEIILRRENNAGLLGAEQKANMIHDPDPEYGGYYSGVVRPEGGNWRHPRQPEPKPGPTSAAAPEPKAKPAAKAKTGAAPKPARVDVPTAVARAEDLYARALDDDHTQATLTKAVGDLFAGLTASEAAQVVAGMGFQRKPKTKAEALKMATDRIVGRRGSYERSQV